MDTFDSKFKKIEKLQQQKKPTTKLLKLDLKLLNFNKETIIVSQLY